MDDGYFSKEHLNIIKEAMEDDVAYSVVESLLGKMHSIIEEARAKGCDQYKCNLLMRRLCLELSFQGFNRGAQHKARICLRRLYEGGGKTLHLDTALSIMDAVDSLVLHEKGMRAWITLRKSRPRETDRRSKGK